MLVSDLIERLTTLEKEHGDLPVRLHADHGQSLMNASWVGLSHIIEDEYVADYAEESLIELGDFIPVIEIQAF